MAGYRNTLNNSIIAQAGLGTSNPSSIAQVAVSPLISTTGITSAFVINPYFSLSSGTVYGEQINPIFLPGSGKSYTVYGLSIAPTMNASGMGTITNAYGLFVSGPSIISATVTNAYSLYVTNASGAGSILNNYTAILGTGPDARVGIGYIEPTLTMHVSGAVKANQVVGITSGTLANNEMITVAEGYNQGGFGGGSVGTNKVMSVNSITCFDLSTVSLTGLGFNGGVFDGRYVYLMPYIDMIYYSGMIARYDTTMSFNSSASYTVFDTTTVNPVVTAFMGGVFDGRYVYLIPNRNNLDELSGQVYRYDTTMSFNASASYTVFDTATAAVSLNSEGFHGGVFDGRYVYFVSSYVYGSRPITRYDTTMPFNSSASYTVFDNVDFTNTGFGGGVFDGRYVYLVPNYSNASAFGQFTRYDTTLSFNSSASYTVFDTAMYVDSNSRGFYAGVFDGRYVYLVPFFNNSDFSGQITRYDTTMSFNASASYTVFDTATAAVSLNSKGFTAGVFDGRYVYLVPYCDGSFGQVTRYDTTMSFNASASYTVFDTAMYVDSNSKGFSGGVFDGHYVYLIPNAPANSRITRIEAYPGPQATAMAAYQAPNGFAIGTYASASIPAVDDLIVSGKMGIGMSPIYDLDLNGDAYKPTSSFWNVTPCDVRVKKNIQDFTGALSVVRQLRPRKYCYDFAYAEQMGLDPYKTHYGFVADEVETVLENCVSVLSGRQLLGAQSKFEIYDLKMFDIHNVMIYSIQAVKELTEQTKKMKEQLEKRKKKNQKK